MDKKYFILGIIGIILLTIGYFTGIHDVNCPHCNACLPCEETIKIIKINTTTIINPNLGICINLLDGDMKKAKHIKQSAEVWSK